jgi:hypothetical protein
MSLIKLLAASSLVVLALSGCATTTSDEAPAESNDATSETSEVSPDENDVTARAEACSEVLADTAADKSSNEYKGCLLETEMPNLAGFLALGEGETASFQVVKDENGVVVELKKFVDTNGNKVMDSDEISGTYTVKTEAMIIEIQGDSDPEMEGTQVSGLSSMLFVVP